MNEPLQTDLSPRQEHAQDADLRPRNSARTHAGLEPPQFRLSTLMIVVTTLSAILGASLVLHPLTTFALVLLMLAVMAHVAGNFYGTKLRDSATRLIGNGSASDPLGQPWSAGHARPQSPQARSRLTDKAPVGIALGVFVMLGSAACMCGGCYWMSIAQAEPVPWPDYLMSAFAFGTLGAFGGFALGGFLCIGYRAVKHAEAESRRGDD